MVGEAHLVIGEAHLVVGEAHLATVQSDGLPVVLDDLRPYFVAGGQERVPPTNNRPRIRVTGPPQISRRTGACCLVGSRAEQGDPRVWGEAVSLRVSNRMLGIEANRAVQHVLAFVERLRAAHVV